MSKQAASTAFFFDKIIFIEKNFLILGFVTK